jgi:hypothetical protein
MKESFILDSDRNHFYCQKTIDGLPTDGSMMVTISPVDTTRRGAQNSLYWTWMTDLADTREEEYAGSTKDEWHDHFKEKALLNIFIRDNTNGTAESMAAVYEAGVNCGPTIHAVLKKAVVDGISTTQATVKQFSEYLSDIQRFCDSTGVRLRTNSELFNRAMGLK